MWPVEENNCRMEREEGTERGAKFMYPGYTPAEPWVGSGRNLRLCAWGLALRLFWYRQLSDPKMMFTGWASDHQTRHSAKKKTLGVWDEERLTA